MIQLHSEKSKSLMRELGVGPRPLPKLIDEGNRLHSESRTVARSESLALPKALPKFIDGSDADAFQEFESYFKRASCSGCNLFLNTSIEVMLLHSEAWKVAQAISCSYHKPYLNLSSEVLRVHHEESNVTGAECIPPPPWYFPEITDGNTTAAF